MGANSATTVSRTLRRGTNTCCAVTGIVQGRAGRNSDLRSLLRVNPFMNLSPHGKWRLNVDAIWVMQLSLHVSFFFMAAICHTCHILVSLVA